MVFLDKKHPLWKELESIAADAGLKLYDVEIAAPIGLRVFVERSEGAMTSGECSKLVRRLMVFFVAEGQRYHMSAEPRIEVSSPGLNRNLRTLEQFRAAVGERVRIQSEDAVVGNICEVDDDAVHLIDEKDQSRKAFRLSEIKRARVEFAFK